MKIRPEETVEKMSAEYCWNLVNSVSRVLGRRKAWKHKNKMKILYFATLKDATFSDIEVLREIFLTY